MSVIKRRCIEFNMKLAKEIQQRLPTNYNVLESMYCTDNTPPR